MSQAIILAAGMGVRLGGLTKNRPKSALPVKGIALINHCLRFVQQVGISDVIVVGGYQIDTLKKAIDACGVNIRLLENKDFRCGNHVSLRVGCDQLAAGGFLVMNADHIYSKGIAKRVADCMEMAEETSVFVDYDRTLGTDDMKVLIEHERLSCMSKTLKTWHAGYTGMTWVPQSRRASYLAVSDQVIASGDLSCNVEHLINLLVQRGDAVGMVDISGIGWWEVDDEHDLECAQAALQRGVNL